MARVEVRSAAFVFDRIPNPDYEKHPAYGGVLPRPTFGLQLKALAAFTPWFLVVLVKRVLFFDRLPAPDDYQPVAGGVGSRVAALRLYLPLVVKGLCKEWARIILRRRYRAAVSELARTFQLDGVAVGRLDPTEREQLRTLMQPYVDRLQASRAAAKRTFSGNQLWLNRNGDGAVFAMLDDFLTRHGVIDAASAYLRRHVNVKHAVLQINDPKDEFNRHKFQDVNQPDPATNYMHIDTSENMVKCSFYLNEVTNKNGPFGYVRGSNHVRVGFFEGLCRRATDRAGLSGYEPEVRRLFLALPRFLRVKCAFGSDVLPGSVEERSLVECEYFFVSEDGDFCLFDNLGIHRGALLEEGERRALLVNLA